MDNHENLTPSEENINLQAFEEAEKVTEAYDENQIQVLEGLEAAKQPSLHARLHLWDINPQPPRCPPQEFVHAV